MKILYFANTDWYLYNFRLSLIAAVKKNGIDIVLVSPPGRYSKMLQEAGLKWIPVNMSRRGLDPCREFKTIIDLALIYKKERPTIVHHFTIKCVIFGSIAAFLAGIQNKVNAVVGMGYIFSSDDVYARILKPLVRIFLGLALSGKNARLIVQNAEDYAYFIQNRYSRKRQTALVKGSGVNTKRFRPAHLNNRGASFKVLFATRLLWDKGIKDFIEAAKIVKNEKHNVIFMIAGAPDPGNPASVTQLDMDEWQRIGLIMPLGYIDDMEKLLKHVDLLVHPTYYREGVPKILLEAASSGVPIIASDVAGCREIIEHMKTGILVEPRKPVELAKAVSYMVSCSVERKRFGRAARNKVLNEFDDKIIIDQTMKVYESFIE